MRRPLVGVVGGSRSDSHIGSNFGNNLYLEESSRDNLGVTWDDSGAVRERFGSKSDGTASYFVFVLVKLPPGLCRCRGS